MTEDGPVKAYRNVPFLNSRDARPLRILSEYLEPDARFEDLEVSDTIVFFGSARIPPRDDAAARLRPRAPTAATWRRPRSGSPCPAITRTPGSWPGA